MAIPVEAGMRTAVISRLPKADNRQESHRKSASVTKRRPGCRKSPCSLMSSVPAMRAARLGHGLNPEVDALGRIGTDRQNILRNARLAGGGVGAALLWQVRRFRSRRQTVGVLHGYGFASQLRFGFSRDPKRILYKVWALDTRCNFDGWSLVIRRPSKFKALQPGG